MPAEHIRVVVSCRQCEKVAPVHCFQVVSSSLGPSVRRLQRITCFVFKLPQEGLPAPELQCFAPLGCSKTLHLPSFPTSKPLGIMQRVGEQTSTFEQYFEVLFFSCDWEAGGGADISSASDISMQPRATVSNVSESRGGRELRF